MRAPDAQRQRFHIVGYYRMVAVMHPAYDKTFQDPGSFQDKGGEMKNAMRPGDTLSIRGGHLFIEECDTVELAKKFGTPVFVFSETQLRNNINRFAKAFASGWTAGPVKVLPAAKANWIPAIQRIIAQEGCGCDIYSPGELQVALDAGFPPEFISVNGIPKDRDHVSRCVAEGVRITIDSIEELEFIEAAAAELNKKAIVRLRLKPVLSGFTAHSDFVAEGLVPTDIAAMAYKGGLTFEQIAGIAPRILSSERIELVGFHQHHGRHHRSTRYWTEQMKAFAAEMGRVCELLGGFVPKEIDIGGGFAIPRDPFNAATDYTEPLQLAALHLISKGLSLLGATPRYKVISRIIDTIKCTPNQIPAPTIEDYAKACTSTLLAHLPENRINPEGIMLQLEPGRALHGDTGIHLSRVMGIKETKQPIRWKTIVVDTTEFWFTGGRYEHHLHHYVFANKADARNTSKADIIGRSCYGDRLLPLVPVPGNIEVGDILAMLDTGAYQEVSMSNFNALPRPASILVKGNEAEIIRKAETQKDVYARDVIPERLTTGSKPCTGVAEAS